MKAVKQQAEQQMKESRGGKYKEQHRSAVGIVAVSRLFLGITEESSFVEDGCRGHDAAKTMNARPCRGDSTDGRRWSDVWVDVGRTGRLSGRSGDSDTARKNISILYVYRGGRESG